LELCKYGTKDNFPLLHTTLMLVPICSIKKTKVHNSHIYMSIKLNIIEILLSKKYTLQLAKTAVVGIGYHNTSVNH